MRRITKSFTRASTPRRRAASLAGFRASRWRMDYVEPFHGTPSFLRGSSPDARVRLPPLRVTTADRDPRARHDAAGARVSRRGVAGTQRTHLPSRTSVLQRLLARAEHRGAYA